MAADTNVVPSVQSYKEFLEQFQQLLATLYVKEGKTKQAELMNKFIEQVTGPNSTSASYSKVEAKYSDAVQDILMKQNIPFIAIPAENGATMIAVPSTYEQELFNAQTDVSFTSADYIMRCDAAELAASAKRTGFHKLMTVQCTNEATAEIAVQKLYQSGISSAMMQNEDGGYTIYAHPQSMYSNSSQDFASFQLQMAYEESKGSDIFNRDDGTNSFLQTRIDQAMYDKETLNSFAKQLKDGSNSVLGNPFGTSNTFLSCQNHELLLHTKDSHGEWRIQTLDVPDDASLNTVANLCSAHADKISNMTIMPTAIWKEKFLDKPLDKEDETVKQYLGIQKDLTGTIKTRPQGKKADLIYHKVAKDEMSSLIDTISKEASKRTAAEFGKVRITNPKDMQKAYEKKISIMCDLLTDKEFGPVKDFIEKGGDLSSEKREAWLNSIKDALSGKSINKKLDFTMGSKKVDKAFIQSLTKDNGKDKDIEKDI